METNRTPRILGRAPQFTIDTLAQVVNHENAVLELEAGKILPESALIRLQVLDHSEIRKPRIILHAPAGFVFSATDAKSETFYIGNNLSYACEMAQSVAADGLSPAK